MNNCNPPSAGAAARTAAAATVHRLTADEVAALTQ